MEWDAENESHIARHGVSRAEVEEVLSGDPLEIPAYAKGEERAAFIGPTHSGRMLFVVVTRRRQTVRTVTAYDARRGMRALYKLYISGGGQ